MAPSTAGALSFVTSLRACACVCVLVFEEGALVGVKEAEKRKSFRVSTANC